MTTVPPDSCPPCPASAPGAAPARVALVTDAGRPLGRHIALGLARDGWDVAVHFRDSEAEARAVVAEIAALGRRAAALCCELTDDSAVRQLLPRAAAALGDIACVVNNAALCEYDDAAGFGLACLDAHMHVNLAAPILLAQALYAATPDGAQAVVINLLDQKRYNRHPDCWSYTLSKAALHGATTMLAQVLAPKIRVVGVATGMILPSGVPTGAAHQGAPLGGSSTPEDVAQAVCYVAGARALTGATLLVDGGQHLAM